MDEYVPVVAPDAPSPFDQPGEGRVVALIVVVPLLGVLSLVGGYVLGMSLQ